MGCDIHGPWMFIQVPRSSVRGHWVKFVGEFHWERDYDAFALLADIRNDGEDAIVPIDKPRGVPDNEWFGHEPWQLEGHGVDNADCHSHTWLTSDELVEAQRRYTARLGSPSSDFMHTITMMRGYEHEYKAKGLGVDVDARIVMCFDN